MANLWAYLAGLLSGIILTALLFFWIAWRMVVALPVLLTSKQIEDKPEKPVPPGVH